MSKRLPNLAVRGFKYAGVTAGLKKSGAPDLGLILADSPVAAAGLFTRNRARAAPVKLSERRLRGGTCQAIVVNSGCANACTGAAGMRDARIASQLAARALGVDEEHLCIASTGVIGRRLDLDKIAAALPALAARARPTAGMTFARAIMTTDRGPKVAAARTRVCTVVGVAKGAGMIAPDMATMLAFVLTDARVAPPALRELLREVTGETFNAISVDGDTSTNDSVFVLASGRASRAGVAQLRPLLRRVMRELAEAIVRDGEGATKVVEIAVEEARSTREARAVARRVALSPLVKTAFFGADPNWGRIACAVGNAGVALDMRRLAIDIGGVSVVRDGVPVEGDSVAARAHEVMRRPSYRIRVGLGRGGARAAVSTCDLSYEYVRINAEYTT